MSKMARISSRFLASLEAELTRNFLEVSAQRTRYVIDLTRLLPMCRMHTFPLIGILAKEGTKRPVRRLPRKLLRRWKRSECGKIGDSQNNEVINSYSHRKK